MAPFSLSAFLENGLVAITDPWNLVSITILAILYYFGILISEALPSRSTRFDVYLQGILFTAIYVIIPFVIAMQIADSLAHILQVHSFVTLILLSFLTGLFGLVYNWKGVIKRAGLLNILKERIREQSEPKIKSFASLLEKFNMKTDTEYWTERSIDSIESLVNLLSSKKAIFLASLLTITLILLTKLDTPIEVVILTVLVFIFYSTLAIAYGLGQAYYPPVLVILSNEKIIEGVLYKQRDDRIILVDPKKKEFVEVPYSQIIEIRQSVLKRRKPTMGEEQ